MSYVRSVCCDTPVAVGVKILLGISRVNYTSRIAVNKTSSLGLTEVKKSKSRSCEMVTCMRRC